MKTIKAIRRKISQIKRKSRRTRQDLMVSVLEDIVDMIEERTGKDISIDEIIKSVEGDKSDEREEKPNQMGSEVL